MRPRRYPYSGKKESTFVKADPKLVQNILGNTGFLDAISNAPTHKEMQIALDSNKIVSGNIKAKNIFGKI